MLGQLPAGDPALAGTMSMPRANTVPLPFNRAAGRGGWLKLSLVAALAVVLLAGPAVSQAQFAPAAPSQQTPPITLQARAGFDGYFKESRWVPVRIMVANDGPDVSGTLQVAVNRTNGTTLSIARAVELPTQSRREIFLYVPIESFASNLVISLVDGNRSLASATVRITQAGQGDLIYGVVAASPSMFGALANVDPVSGSAYLAQLELGDLPPAASAWQSLDVLVFSDVDTGSLSLEQRAALAGWVSSGGRLIVAGGPSWQKTAAGLAELLPLAPSGTQTLPGAEALAEFALASPAEGSGVVAVGALAEDAATVVSAGDVPLVVTRRSGYGQVTFLALDPSFEPLRGWPGLDGMFRNLLAGASERPSWAGGVRNWYSARDAVNAMPGLDFPSALQVCGFLSIYLVAVGPVNYLVLKRLKRRELAWVTIPAIVLVFSVGAYLTGNQLRGVQAVLHRLAIVQVWPDSDFARVDETVGLFSPRRSDYDLVFNENFLARPMPVDGFGGSGANYTVEQADQTQISDVRMEVGGLEPFVTQGQVPAPAFESDLALDVTRSAVALRGTVTNRSSLALTDVVLLGPGGVERLGEFAPGETLNVNLALQNSRAAPAAANTILPASAAGTTFSQPYYPPSIYDTTIDDILGSSGYFNDREQYRRYSLLSSIIDSYGGAVRGGGVYLVGWSDRSPTSMQVLGRGFSAVDTALYFVNLRPTLDDNSAEITIPPGLMTWLSISAPQTSSASPYDMYLYQGNEYVLRFAPSQLLSFSGVNALTLHLTSYGSTGQAGVSVELWDFSESTWVAQPTLQWGDNTINRPERHVGPGGEIQVRVRNAGQPQLSLERLDFTLLAER